MGIGITGRSFGCYAARVVAVGDDSVAASISHNAAGIGIGMGINGCS